MIIPTCTSTRSVQESWLSPDCSAYSLATPLHGSRSGVCVVVAHCALICISLVSNELKHLLIRLLEYLVILFYEVPI